MSYIENFWDPKITEARVPNWLTASSKRKANTFLCFHHLVTFFLFFLSLSPLFKESLTAPEAAVALCLT